MTDTLFIALIALLWLATLVLAYGTGWVKGYEISEDKHRWSRWFLRNEFNRRTRL